MAGGPQKPDHGGNFIMIPRKLLASQAWRDLSPHARATLLVFFDRHNGFNNGSIALGVREISAAIGNQNHAATSRSIGELIMHGFIECTSDADHHKAKARTYRITSISTGDGRKGQPATNEYLDWRPAPSQRKKFGGARTATQNAVSVIETATDRKFPVAVSATPPTVISGFGPDPRVAVTATLIGNQSSGCSGSSEGPEIVRAPSRPAMSRQSTGEGIGVGPDELRAWVHAAITIIGYGGAKQLAHSAKVPEPVLSRFRQGKSLPDHHAISLQTACGRVLPYNKWKAAA